MDCLSKWRRVRIQRPGAGEGRMVASTCAAHMIRAVLERASGREWTPTAGAKRTGQELNAAPARAAKERHRIAAQRHVTTRALYRENGMEQPSGNGHQSHVWPRAYDL